MAAKPHAADSGPCSENGIGAEVFCLLLEDAPYEKDEDEGEDEEEGVVEEVVVVAAVMVMINRSLLWRP